MRIRLVPAWHIALVMLVAVSLRADDAPTAATSPLSGVLAGIDHAHGPAWLKPGVRLTYYQSSALIPGGFDELVRDEKGEIVSRKTGQRFDEIHQQGIAANTYTKLDIAAVSQNAVALDEHAYTQQDSFGHYLAPMVMGEIVPPGHGGDTWIDPAILNRQPDSHTDATMIYREEYTLGDKTYHGIAYSVRTEKSWTYAIYDLESGLLLHMLTAGVGAGHTVRNGTNIERGENDTILTQSTFVSLRQMQPPWANSHLPPAAGADRLSYQGARVISMSGVTTTIPIKLELAAHDRAGDVLPLKISIGEYALGPNAAPITSSIERVITPAELMPLFIDPVELDKLQQGQEIDRDPETRYVETVSFVGKSPRGRDIVALTESAGPENPSTQYIYDKSNGVAIAFIVDIPALHQRIAVAIK